MGSIEWCVGVLWGCRDGIPAWNTYQLKVCAPYCGCGLKVGGVEVLVEGVVKVRWRVLCIT